MASRPVICYILVLWIILVYYVALGKQESTFNNHVVSSIKTKYGDIFDCVDFYHQPSLNHPLLTNHSFYPEMRPTSVPKGITRHTLNPNDQTEIQLRSSIIRLKDGGCPRGTVPIRRMKEDVDLAHFFKSKVLLEKVARSKNMDAIKQESDNYFIAMSHTKFKMPFPAYYGVQSFFSAFNPRVYEVPQFSSAEMIIQNGLDRIIVGWIVDPSLYPANQTRFFVYTNMGGKACYNGQCGFISVRQDIPPDFLIHPISQRGGPINVIKTLVYKDPSNGNWWLQVNDTAIGFWPGEIFKDLGASGNFVACGGIVYCPKSHEGVACPGMGSGVIPDGRIVDDAWCGWFQVVNDKNQLVEVQDTEEAATNRDIYDVWDEYESGIYGHMVLFGGPLNQTR